MNWIVDVARRRWWYLLFIPAGWLSLTLTGWAWLAFAACAVGHVLFIGDNDHLRHALDIRTADLVEARTLIDFYQGNPKPYTEWLKRNPAARDQIAAHLADDSKWGIS